MTGTPPWPGSASYGPIPDASGPPTTRFGVPDPVTPGATRAQSSNGDRAGVPAPFAAPDGPVADPARAASDQAAASVAPNHPVKTVERAHPLTPFVKGWLILVGCGWFVIREYVRPGEQNPQNLPLELVLAGMGLIVVLASLAGLVSWLTTRFIADDDELRVETGWLLRQSRRISYSRIQSVDVVQPLAARLFGLAQLQIDAGGDSTKVQFLSRLRAYQMRDDLMRRAHGHRTGVTDSLAPSGGLLEDLGAQDQVLVRVQPQQLLLGAVASHDLLGLVLALVFPAALVAIVLALWPNSPILGNLKGYLAVGSLVPVGLAVASYLSNRVVAQFNYSLARTPAGLRITRGLTNLTSQTIPAHRIQSIRIAQPLLWRWLRRWRLDVEVLGYGKATTNEDTKQVSTILLPIGDEQQVAAALAAVWPRLQLDRLVFTGSPRRARWLDPLAYSWNGIACDDTVVVTRRGWMTRLQSIVPHARLQSVQADQGPWQRRLRLANVWFHTTGTINSHAAIHLDADLARQIVYRELDQARASRAEELLGRPADDGAMTMPPVPHGQQGPGPAGPLHPDRIPAGPLHPDRIPAGPLPGQSPVPLLPDPRPEKRP